MNESSRCLHCINYSVNKDMCCLEGRCKFEIARCARKQSRLRQRPSEVFRDLLGNQVEECGERKLLKPRKQRTTAAESPLSLEDNYGSNSFA
jgi:hypothetical protein